MKQQAYAQLKPYLLPGETLLWCGRPSKGFRWTLSHLLLGVVLLAITGLWLILLNGAVRNGGGFWIAVFILTLIVLSSWRGIVQEWLGIGRPAYGVTNRRLLIVESGIRPVEKSISYSSLRDVTFTGTRRFGTVRCARGSMPWKNQNKPGRMSRPALFQRIFDAGDVCDLILTQCASVVGVNGQNANDSSASAPARITGTTRDDPWLAR